MVRTQIWSRFHSITQCDLGNNIVLGGNLVKLPVSDFIKCVFLRGCNAVAEIARACPYFRAQFGVLDDGVGSHDHSHDDHDGMVDEFGNKYPVMMEDQDDDDEADGDEDVFDANHHDASEPSIANQDHQHPVTATNEDIVITFSDLADHLDTSTAIDSKVCTANIHPVGDLNLVATLRYFLFQGNRAYTQFDVELMLSTIERMHVYLNQLKKHGRSPMHESFDFGYKYVVCQLIFCELNDSMSYQLPNISTCLIVDFKYCQIEIAVGARKSASCR
jgi:hypothetical protein